jgi:hypothetical protein
MRIYRAKQGPFHERPFFEQNEIEALCLEELRKVGLLPSAPQEIRIERFVEKRFGTTPVYEDLPDGVLGFTRFSPKGVAAIVISRVLSEEESKTAAPRKHDDCSRGWARPSPLASIRRGTATRKAFWKRI